MRTRVCLLALACSIVGCASPTGGWDIDRLLADHPAIAELPGQRIGDMTPYPAWLGARLIAVACRFDRDEPVTLRGQGPGWQAEWAGHAVESVDRGVAGVALALVEESAAVPVSRVSIEIESISDPEARGPDGLADTLAICDVSPMQEGGVEGRIARATIRIRRALPLPTGRVHRADQAEWTGALLHELGHALGFAGHAAIGDSIVHLEQSRLRSLGRRSAVGEGVPMPTMSALYQIEPGRELARPSILGDSQEAVASVLALVSERTKRLGPPSRMTSIAGDSEARLVWVWPGGVTAAIDFPDWRRALSSGRPVRAVPSSATRRALDALSRAGR